ncbi:MAG: aminotransferase class V-fold PLP-dependent enzyme [Streptococcaceae bacterium]|jgi:cysteine desulfurase family protein|nr:aminotransferase class V-fold PLP-dependent enzyme [Streptococcaceae bacterium]
MTKHYYFDNATTTLQKPKQVATAMSHVILSNEYATPSRGSHAYSLNAYRLVEETREVIKQFFHATNQYEVAFTNNATTSLNLVIKGLIKPNDHVLTTVWEHNSVLRPLYQLQAQGVEVDFVSAMNNGQLNYQEFAEKLKPNTKAIVCNHASNVTGNVMDIAFLKDFCKKHQLLLILDVSQSAGSLAINLSDEMIAAICFTGHKGLYGPQGIGGIVIKNDLDISPVLTGGDGQYSFSKEQPALLPTVFEAGTLNIPGIAGLKAGIEWVQTQEKSSIGSYFYEGLKNIPEIQLYGDFESKHVDVFSINIADVESSLVGELLWEKYQIATRTGYHCAPKMHEALNTQNQGSVRFSLSRFTTKEEVDYVLNALKEIVQGG